MRIYSQERKFYVYQYLRKNDSKNGLSGSPFYIGKGSGNRIKQKDHCVKVPEDIERIQIISENLTESEAFQLEIELISKYGRIDLGTGCLRNRTNGGDGATGLKYTEQSRKLQIEKSLKTKRINGTLKHKPGEMEKSVAVRMSKGSYIRTKNMIEKMETIKN